MARKPVNTFVLIALFLLGFSTGTHAAEKQLELEDHLTGIVASYIDIQKALSGDSVSNVAENADAIATHADAALTHVKKEAKDQKEFAERLERIKTAAAAFSKDLDDDEALDIDNARRLFYALSLNVVELVNERLTARQAANYHLFYCPMAKGYWLQDDEEKLRNPYYGSEMLTCGKKQSYMEDYDPAKSKYQCSHNHKFNRDCNHKEHKHKK